MAKESANRLETVSKDVPAVPGSVGPLEQQSLHAQTVTALLPLAGRVVADVLNGKGKASPACRASTALEVMRQAQVQAQKTGGGSLPAGAVEALTALGRALAGRISKEPEPRDVGVQVVSEQ